MPATWMELFEFKYVDPASLVRVSDKVDLTSLDFPSLVQELLCDGEDIDVSLLELLSDVRTIHFDLLAVDVQDLLLNQLLLQLRNDMRLNQLDPEQLRLADYPNDAAVMVRRLLGVGAPLCPATLLAPFSDQEDVILLEAALAVGRGEELLRLRREVVAAPPPCQHPRHLELAETKLSVLRRLRRCGWCPGPDDDEVNKAKAWWREEVQHWNDYRKVRSYGEAHCRKIIERYERRLAFFDTWELAMQSEARVLVRILAEASRDEASVRHLPILAARRVAAFVGREPSPESIEVLPEQVDIVCNSKQDQHDETVIQLVYRGLPTEEPAAQIPEEEASALESQLWASRIEQLVTNNTTDQPEGQRLVLLFFARCPKELGQALRQSELAQSLKQRDVDVQPQWADGALVLASGIGPDDIVDDRGTWNVAVRDADEHHVFEALRNLPYNIRPRLKGDARFVVPSLSSLFQPSESSASASAGSSDPEEILVERTFIHVPPEPMASVSDPPPTV